jgi:hypothetical protein
MATPITTVTCTSLTQIDGTDCIGDSRSIINTNIQNLGTSLCTLSTINNTFNANDTQTIDLTWTANTRTLKADVQKDSIRYSNLASWQTLSASPTLSAEAVQPRLASAWVRFSVSSGVYTLHNKWNVASVSYTGSYHRVTFTDTINTNNLIITGTGGSTSDGGGTRYLFVSPIQRGANYIDFIFWAHGGGGGLAAVNNITEINIVGF